MKVLLFNIVIIVAFLHSCNFPRQSSSTIIKSDTVINFTSHIKLFGQRSKDFGGSSFNPIEILINNEQIFFDSTNEYWLSGFESKQFPKLLECTDGSIQLLIEVDERPNANELQQIKISKEGHVQTDRLPIFNWVEKDIDNDGKMEVSGILTNGETIAEGDTAFYNPTLVYELTNSCLKMDSTATREINKKIWGEFYGYYYNDSLILPYDPRNK